MRSDTKQIILDEFRNSYCISNSMFQDEGVENYKPSILYENIYKNTPMEYRLIFSTAHEKINNFLELLNSKITSENLHYNADNSRQFKSIISGIFRLKNELLSLGVVMDIDSNYEKKMNETLGFLKESYGSEIPKSIQCFEIKRLGPIFHIKDDVSEKRMSETKVPFSSEHQKERAKELLSEINIDTVTAIGGAKDYVETCLQGILMNNIEKDVDKLNMIELNKEARIYFKLNDSKLKEVQTVVSGITQILHGIVELRNHKGSGHSHTEKVPKPTVTEARLAVDSAITIVNFYADLYSRQNNRKTN